jgi:hypothetical protein
VDEFIKKYGTMAASMTLRKAAHYTEVLDMELTLLLREISVDLQKALEEHHGRREP